MITSESKGRSLVRGHGVGPGVAVGGNVPTALGEQQVDQGGIWPRVFLVENGAWRGGGQLLNDWAS